MEPDPFKRGNNGKSSYEQDKGAGWNQREGCGLQAEIELMRSNRVRQGP